MLELRLWYQAMGTPNSRCPVMHSASDPKLDGSTVELVSFYRGIIDAALDAVIAISANGLVEFLNPAAEQLFGYSASEVIGRNISMLMPSPERERHDAYLERYVSTGERRIIGTEREVFAQRKDNSLFPIELSVTEVNVEGRRIFSGVIRDVSARRKAEASISLLDSIVASPDGAIIVRNLAGTIVQWNHGAELLYGFTSEEAVGKPADLIVPASRIQELQTATQRILAGQPSERLDTVRTRKDGKEISVALTLSPIHDVRGMIAGIVVSSHDISTLKERERDLRRAERYAQRLVETANAMIVILDEHGRVLLFNPAAEQISGFRSDEVIGKKWVDVFVPEEGRAQSSNVIAETLAGRRQEHEGVLITKAGEPRIISWRNSLLVDQGSDAALSFGLDITEAREKERLLQRVRDDLEIRVGERTAELSLANQILEREIADRQRAEESIASSLREKEVFLKEIHHRVKNNLQLVISILNLHLSESDGGGSVDTLAEIRDRIYAIAHLHETLYQSGDLVHVNIEEYLRGVVSNLVHSSGESADIDVVFEIEAVSLNIDETLRCGLIVNELVLNSLKHAFFGKSRGRIIVSISREPRGPLRITVMDDGIGFPEKGKLENSRSIGFHLVEKLTEKLEGEVKYSNTPGARIDVSFMPEEEHT